MPGPPPKPLEQKRKLGNPGKRSISQKSNLVALPSMPADRPSNLGAAGSEFWDDVIRICRPWLGASDYHVLGLAAEAMDRRAFFLRVLSEEGWSVMTDKGYPYKHPLVGALTELEAQITKWLSLLGLTPTDRSRLGLAEVKAQTKLEALREKQK
jgi:P27 family predicted phage terminase small subunit